MFRDITIPSVMLRVLLAVIVGGVLGLERGRKNRPAGFRTYILVSVGSALVMLTNQYAYEQFGVSDPVRMGAQVISGIGFLGAGTILVRNNTQVKGITTAAGLWAAACCGLAIGIGFYEGAVIGSLTIFLVLTVLQRLDGHIHSCSKIVDVYMEYESRFALSTLLEFAKKSDLYISDIQINKSKMDKGGELLNVVLGVKSAQKRTHTEIIELLSSAQGVLYIEEL